MKIFGFPSDVEREIKEGIEALRNGEEKEKKRKEIGKKIIRVAHEKKELERILKNDPWSRASGYMSRAVGEKEEKEIREKLAVLEETLRKKREYVVSWIRDFLSDKTVGEILEHALLSFPLSNKDNYRGEEIVFKKKDSVVSVFFSWWSSDCHKTYDGEEELGSTDGIKMEKMNRMSDENWEYLYADMMTGEINKKLIDQLYDLKILVKTPTRLKVLFRMLKRSH